MKLLVIGNIGSGKTTFCEKLVSSIDNVLFVSIDDLRKELSDGTIVGEYLAYTKLIEIAKEKMPSSVLVMEFSGAGVHKYAIKEAIRSSEDFCLIFYIYTDPQICKKRISNRVWDLPYPWNVNPVDMIETISAELEKDYDSNFWKLSNTKVIKLQINSEIDYEKAMSIVQNFAQEGLNKHEEEQTYPLLEKKSVIINMKTAQEVIINALIKLSKADDQIRGLISYGSYGRNENSYNSDLDLIMVVTNTELKETIVKAIKQELQVLSFEIFYHINYPEKLILFLRSPYMLKPLDVIKVEISFTHDIEKLAIFIAGSNLKMSHLNRVLLLSKDKNIRDSVIKILTFHERYKRPKSEEIRYQINRILELFHLATISSKKSDHYRFYFYLSVVYHHLVVLESFKHKEIKYPYLPKYVNRVIPIEIQDDLETLVQFPSLKYHDRYQTLTKFYRKIKEMLDEYKNYIHEPHNIDSFLKICIEYSLLKNFRDIACVAPILIQHGICYRSAALSDINRENFKKVIHDFGIKTLIDLRTEKEREDNKFVYDIEVLQELNVNYINIPINLHLRQSYHENKNISYYVGFLHEFKDAIKGFFKNLITAETPILFHCAGGKDRTGMLTFLLYMLLKVDAKDAIIDYLVSERDGSEDCIIAFYKELTRLGGIEQYLESLGLTKEELQKIKSKFYSHK